MRTSTLRLASPLLAAIVLFFSSIYSINAQKWTDLLPAKDQTQLTLKDYQTAFNGYWDPFEVEGGYYLDQNGEQTKASGWKQFKRWEWYWERKVDPITGAFPSITSDQAYERWLMTQGSASRAGTANWSLMGPDASLGGYAGIGRVNCIAFHPTDLNTFWVGAASGGLWQTTDGGSNWTILTDHLDVLGISDILVNPDFATSGIMYIATGDKDHWDNRSIGVLKSTDGGTSWSATALSYTVSQGKMVNRLLMDPLNSQVIIAATTDGVYKTTDGGTTWGTQLTGSNFIDMEYKPGDFATLYGCRTGGGEVHRSIDAGANWSMTLNTAGARVELAVTPASNATVYALISEGDGLFGIYSSADSGASFIQTFDGLTSGNNLLGWSIDGSDTGGQGWYDLALAVSPTNANTLFVGGVNNWGSYDGGVTWELINHWYGGGNEPAVHADKHWLVYRPNGDLFECNDGGVYISSDDGVSWTDKTNTMAISQIYRLSVSQTVPTEVQIGLQDNGTKLITGGVWSDVRGGDGMECIIDYTNANTQYNTYVNGDIRRTYDHWVNSTGIKPSGASGAWVTPYIIDPVDPNTLYAGFQNIYKTTDQGNSWTNIFNENSSGRFRAMAIAPSNTQVLYVSDTGNIWKTTDGGANWASVENNLPNVFITYISVKNDDPNTVWVSMSTYSGNSVYESTDGGASWTNISNGLPALPANCVIQNKQISEQTDLFLATDVGVYYKEGAAAWVAFNDGLPNVDVQELEFYYDDVDTDNTMLRAASYGRGLWESPINDPVQLDPDQSRDLVFSDVTLDDITVSWTNGSGTNRIVKISNSGYFSTPVNGSDPTSNTVYSGGEQVIYNGPGAPVTVTGLEAGTTYYFRVFDYDGDETTTVYNIAPGYNNPEHCTSYCRPSSNDLDDDYIARFILNSIDNASDETEFTDFSDISTALMPGHSYDLSVEVGDFDENLSLWIDLNDNWVFDLSEQLIDDFDCEKNTISTTTIVIPETVILGSHRLRARVSYNTGADPCEEVSWGEAEDYTVEFKDYITWTGAIDTDWFEPLNWDVGVVPTLEYEVFIPDTPNQPLIGVGLIGAAKKITTEAGTNLIVEGELNVD